MSKHFYRSIFFLGILIVASTTFIGCSKKSSSLPPGVEYYTCSMHPTVRSDKPGQCPICGMNLTAVRSKNTASGSSQSVEKTNQESKSTAPAKDNSKTVDYYTCSMHPQVRADKPGNCPICGMTLGPVYSSPKNATTPGVEEVHLTNDGIRQAGVQIEIAEKRKLAKELLIFGTIGYNQNLHRDVVSLVSGRIDAQLIDFNQTEVKKGDPLVRLYSPEAISLQKEYLKSLRERWLSTFYERELLTSMIRLSEEELKKIGFTEADLNKIEKDKEVNSHILVRAPVSGSIVGNMVHIGEMVKAEQALYHIVPLDELWFNAQVFEQDLGLLRSGQTVRISTKSFPDQVFTGKLTFIGRTLDEINRTVSVRFTISNKDRKLLPNLSASGRLEIPISGDVPSVPNSAVLDLGTRHVVYLEKGEGIYVARNVRIGFVTQHYTQIVEGISEGDKVVSAGAFLVDAQAQLRAGTGTMTPEPGAQEPMSTTPAAPVHHH